jgi:hypothetical protein
MLRIVLEFGEFLTSTFGPHKLRIFQEFGRIRGKKTSFGTPHVEDCFGIWGIFNTDIWTSQIENFSRVW